MAVVCKQGRCLNHRWRLFCVTNSTTCCFVFPDPKIGMGGPYFPPKAHPVPLSPGRHTAHHMPCVYICTYVSLGDDAVCANFVGFRGSVPLLPHLCPLSVPEGGDMWGIFGKPLKRAIWNTLGLFSQISKSIHIPPPPYVMTCLHMEAKLVKNPKKCQNTQSWHLLNVPERHYMLYYYIIVFLYYICVCVCVYEYDRRNINIFFYRLYLWQRVRVH